MNTKTVDVVVFGLLGFAAYLGIAAGSAYYFGNDNNQGLIGVMTFFGLVIATLMVRINAKLGRLLDKPTTEQSA